MRQVCGEIFKVQSTMDECQPSAGGDQAKASDIDTHWSVWSGTDYNAAVTELPFTAATVGD